MRTPTWCYKRSTENLYRQGKRSPGNFLSLDTRAEALRLRRVVCVFATREATEPTLSRIGSMGIRGQYLTKSTLSWRQISQRRFQKRLPSLTVGEKCHWKMDGRCLRKWSGAPQRFLVLLLPRPCNVSVLAVRSKSNGPNSDQLQPRLFS